MAVCNSHIMEVVGRGLEVVGRGGRGVSARDARHSVATHGKTPHTFWCGGAPRLDNQRTDGRAASVLAATSPHDTKAGQTRADQSDRQRLRRTIDQVRGHVRLDVATGRDRQECYLGCDRIGC